MNARKTTQTLRALALGFSLLGLTSCGKESNPTITVKFGSLVASHPVLDFLIPNAYAAVGDIQMCIKRLRFKQEDNDDGLSSDELQSGSDNVDFSPGPITVTPGQTIGEFPLVAGTYKRIEIDLEQDCNDSSGAPSVSWNNSTSYVSNETITIKFEGAFEASSSGQELDLGMAAIVSAMEGLTGGATGQQIKNALEDASGEMD